MSTCLPPLVFFHQVNSLNTRLLQMTVRERKRKRKGGRGGGGVELEKQNIHFWMHLWLIQVCQSGYIYYAFSYTFRLLNELFHDRINDKCWLLFLLLNFIVLLTKRSPLKFTNDAARLTSQNHHLTYATVKCDASKNVHRMHVHFVQWLYTCTLYTYTTDLRHLPLRPSPSSTACV